MRKVFSIFIAFYLVLAPEGMAQPLMPTGVSSEKLVTEILWQSVRKLKVGERPKIVLLLGGGGARGMSHIGVLRVFEQEQIPIDEIVGVSVGALVGALYAGGVSVDKLDRMAHEVGWDKLTDLNKVGIVKLILKEELLSTKKMETYLEEHLGKKNFSDLNIPFSCIATDIRTGEKIVFNKGPVAIAARASATVPGLFRPVTYEGRLLVDGGLIESLPMTNGHVDDWKVTVGILPKVQMENYELGSILSSLVRSIEIQKNVILKENRKNAEFLIEPDLNSVSIIEIQKGPEVVEAGLLATRARALALKKLIIQKVLEKKKETIGER